ncbi:hypothetical protein ABEB36_010106 [Hypothenemus hampei]|uniref:Dynein regulatory complex protein 1 n=1 Tax=Hypothenemus hampei TaxID=57062 RepID=A0ABD1EJ10_HYPHA
MSIHKSDIIDELEPQVTSTDPNERKLARRLRIERRQQAVKKSKLSIQQVEKSIYEEIEDDNIQLQLKKSAELLEKLLIEGEEYITNVRVANDSREVDRREYEGINKEKIYEQLEDESQSANQLFNEIVNKWTSIQRQNDPLHINDAIIEQKEKCSMLISQKDGIIAMLNDELKNAEKQFTKDQKKQIDDINILSQRIEKQISFMRRAYREELEILENVIQIERDTFIENNNKIWEDLFKKQQNQEISNMNTKFEQVEEFHNKMEHLRIDFQDHYRETKIKLENDIEELQRELEKIKSLTLLNSEKLDYNYQILKKCEDENIIIKSQQKRRMNKLQDVINDLRREISDYETSSSNKIKKLSENIKKLHQSILDIEAKADHFAHVNDEKFHMLWKMNKTRVLEVLKKILDTDKILYEQQMGLDWDPPPNSIIDKKSLPSYKLAMNHVDPDFIYEEKVEADIKSVKSRKSIFSQGHTELDALEVFHPPNATCLKLLKLILTRISDSSGFLAEKRLKELLKGYTDDQKHIVRLDNVFAALGIQNSKYINILFKHFLPYTYCPICQGSLTISPYRMESYVSATSQLSATFCRYGDTTNICIPEVDEVINAIRQPDNMLASIINQLVNVEDISEEDENGSEEMSICEPIENVCGVAIPNDCFDKDKIRTVSSRKKISISKTAELSSCQNQHPLVISPVYVLRALKEFVADYYLKTVGAPTTGARLEKKRMTISRFLTENDIKMYWEKFKDNFGENRVRVWDALLSGLKKYHEILKDRRVICDEVLKLRKENAELKRLLANYLDHHDVLPAVCANDRSPI